MVIGYKHHPVETVTHHAADGVIQPVSFWIGLISHEHEHEHEHEYDSTCSNRNIATLGPICLDFLRSQSKDPICFDWKTHGHCRIDHVA